jgi:hypothetical protein
MAPRRVGGRIDGDEDDVGCGGGVEALASKLSTSSLVIGVEEEEEGEEGSKDDDAVDGLVGASEEDGAAKLLPLEGDGDEGEEVLAAAVAATAAAVAAVAATAAAASSVTRFRKRT